MAAMPEQRVTDNLEQLLDVLPLQVRGHPVLTGRREELLEIVLDLGREPEARFPGEVISLSPEPVTHEDLDYVANHTGDFGEDNRAGIERTLHRISAIRNRQGRIVGLTCRIGRSVYGTVDIIRDIVETGKSLLLLGRPGIGKTTKLREVARVLADELNKRVVVVDTSNEIAGDGDIPHPAIGRARRMQVSRPDLQHAVMIEAVENHMPEVIVIDEIGTEAEALAARTIAERGVQLIGTAHGNTLDNLMMNPTLSDLIGGIHAVTLSDEEAKRRGTQKTVLERKAPPTFEVVVEIIEMDKLAIHHDVAEVVDCYLRGLSISPEIRLRRRDGAIEVVPAQEAGLELREGPQEEGERFAPERPRLRAGAEARALRLFTYGVSRSKLQRALGQLALEAELVKSWEEADAVLALKAYQRREPARFQEAARRRLPVHIVRSNTQQQITLALQEVFHLSTMGLEQRVLRETQAAIARILQTSEPVELPPVSSYLRRLQHEAAAQHGLNSRSIGVEPKRRVRISK
jgi:stage III sporulation protein SpoIIIAA